MNDATQQYEKEKPIREWLYRHPDYDFQQIGLPPYTEDQARKYNAVYLLINVFESDFNILASYVKQVAIQALEKERDPAIQKIYQDFVSMVDDFQAGGSNETQGCMYVYFHTGSLWPCELVFANHEYAWVKHAGIVYRCLLTPNTGAIEAHRASYVPDSYYDAAFLNFFGPAC